MRMYVMLAVAALLLAGLLFLLDRALKAVRTGRRRRDAGIRLAVAAARAEDEAREAARQRAQVAQASGALTTVLPSIQQPGPGPRRVA
jgi:hypothetical protein